MIIVGVDVGGTFTDLILADTGRARTVVHKVASTPDDPSRGGAPGAGRAVPEGRRRHRLGQPRAARHDRRHQCHARAQGCPHRHGDHRGLSRHPPYRPPPAPAELLDPAGDPLAGASAGQAAPPSDRARAAGAAARRGAGAAGRGRRAHRGASAARVRASRPSPSAFSSATSTPRTKNGPRRSCGRSFPARSSRPPRQWRRSSASSSASRRRP